ncbi:MAG: hypothetical protein AAGD32_01280 [Planctomycetota bacterium]
MRNVQRQRGFFEIDAALGVFILAAVLATIVVAATAINRSSEVQADRRAALRLAERALLEPEALPDDAGVTFADLGQTGDGRRWVEATATVNEQSASLVAALSEVPR